MGKQHSSAIEIIHRIDCGPDRGMAHGAKSEYRLEPDIEVAENFGLTRKQLAWFKDAKVASVLKVKLLHHEHLYWPDLDVDLELESIKHPENYPLTCRPTA